MKPAPPSGQDDHVEPRVYARLGAAGLLPPSTEQERKEITDADVDLYQEQSRFLPIANVARLMKKCLPSTTKVTKDAKLCVQEATSEFISFVASEAADRCQGDKRKTINGEDILASMTALGFENYSDVLKIYLTKYRERVTGKRSSKKRTLDDTTKEETTRSLPVGTAGGAGFAGVEKEVEEDAEEDYDDSEFEEP